VPELQPLRADHALAVLAFETANRGYFAASISDRGDEYFEHFTERHNALLAEQEAGVGAYYVLVDEDGSVLGRFNLGFVAEGVAELGYRVAQHVAGCDNGQTERLRKPLGLRPLARSLWSHQDDDARHSNNHMLRRPRKRRPRGPRNPS